MKTLNFEISKRLNDLWLLDNIETEKVYLVHSEWYDLEDYNHYLPWDIKTLTTEEAIEFLPKFILEKQNFRDDEWNILLIWYNIKYWDFETWLMKQFIFAIEKLLEYLLNNNLLWKQ